MNRKRWIASLVVCQCWVLLGTCSSVFAQTNVAIIDIGAVFKSHAAFSQQLESLRAEAEQFKANSAQLQRQLVQKAEVLKQYTPGSAEYKSAETQLAQESAAMEVEQRNKMRTMMQREARLHFDTYAQVNQVIADYCDQQQIQLTLRFSRDPVDMKNPNSIMQKVNGSILYYEQQKDITPQIIARITQLSSTQNAAGASGQIR